MKLKRLTIWVAMTFCLLMVSIKGIAADTNVYKPFTDDQGISWTYTTWDDNGTTEARLWKCDYSGTGTVTVPEKTDGGLTISSIASDVKHLNDFFTSACKVIMPSTLVEIEEKGLENSLMTSLDFSKCTNLKEIPQSMCSVCPNLVSVIFPSSLKKIGVNAFVQCEALASVEIPGSVETIGDAAFIKCSGLTKVKFDDADTPKLTIGNNAFGECPGLTDITFGTNVKVIGNLAFQSSVIKNAIKFNEGLEEIGDFAFNSCQIKKGALNLPSTLKKLGDVPWGSMYPAGSDKSVGWYFNNDLSLPDGLEYIGKYSFLGAKKITKELKLPSHLKHIGINAFSMYPVVGELVIPASVESIDMGAFNNMPFLTKVSFESGSKLTSLGDKVFANDYNLRYIDLTAATSLSAFTCSRSSGVFQNLPIYTLVYLPSTFSDIKVDNFIYENGGQKTCYNFLVYDTNKNYLPATQKAANSYTYLTNNMPEEEIATIDAQYAAMPTNRGCDYEIPYAFTAQSATYYRAFKTGTLTTISLPYSGGELPVGVKAFKLVSTFQTTESYHCHSHLFLPDRASRKHRTVKNWKAHMSSAVSPIMVRMAWNPICVPIPLQVATR
ncbi:MAG: leucine-rich repeat protein [Prevotellaceae bacterium]|nr:leucine-rich repeat protein [Prevotellaceae bacterium]